MLSHWSFYDKPAKTIPFHLKGNNGKIVVYYGANDDPIKAGFDSLAGLNFDTNLCRGYPVMHARIEDYAGSGYRTFCGWIQIVKNVYLDHHQADEGSTQTYLSVDIAPAFEESNIPFATYGHLPQLFDAPCHNLGSHAELQWTADTFLTTVPARSRDEEITWLAGFRWGYTEIDIPDQKPTLLPLEVTSEQIWNSHLAYLQKEYKDWRFKNT